VVWYLLSNLLYRRNTLDLSPKGELQRNVLKEPVLVDLGTYINLPSRPKDQMSHVSSKTSTKVGTVFSIFKGSRNNVKGLEQEPFVKKGNR
jgi:hypothetical protein